MLSENDIIAVNSKFGLDDYPLKNSLLSSVMKKLRQKRVPIPKDEIYSLLYLGNIVQLWLQSPPCRFSEAGFCTICNYWKGHRIDNIVASVTASAKIQGHPKSILLNTCGSVLDTYELPLKEREYLFSWIRNLNIPEVIIETHLSTLTPESLRHVAEFLPDKQICFEVGIESMNPNVLFYYLNKPCRTDDFRKILLELHRYKNFRAIANIILGSPFMTKKEQEADAINSILSLLEIGFDYAVIFPVNIKPLTVPALLYENGMYDRILLDSLINVLERLPDEILPLVNTAWYGNRSEEGVIPPDCGCEEKVKLIDIYNTVETPKERREILNHLCRLRAKNTSNSTLTFKARLESGYSFLKSYLL